MMENSLTNKAFFLSLSNSSLQWEHVYRYNSRNLRSGVRQSSVKNVKRQLGKVKNTYRSDGFSTICVPLLIKSNSILLDKGWPKLEIVHFLQSASLIFVFRSFGSVMLASFHCWRLCFCSDHHSPH